MANNINNIRDNTSIGTERSFSADQQEVADTVRVVRAQESLDNIRTTSTVVERGQAAASAFDKSFVSRSSQRPSTGAVRSDTGNSVNSDPKPLLSIIGNERIGPGYELHNADGSVTRTSINDQGLYQELTTNADRSTSLTVYQDFPADTTGSPTGYRMITTNKDARGKVTTTTKASLVITSGTNGTLVANLVDLTDPSHPINKYSSILTLSGAVDDNNQPLYNSKTTLANGDVITKTHEKLVFGEQFDPRMLKGYSTNISTKAADGTITNSALVTLSETTEQGNRLTSIGDVTNPDSTIMIAQNSRPDPFLHKFRTSGKEISEYLDYLSKAGYLDITGDGTLDPKSDLLLINRYARGLRGNKLIENIDLGTNPPDVATLEAKLAKGLANGVYDINGSGLLDPNTKVNITDINLIARYMFGARDSALTDRREANDESIDIAANGSNIVKLSVDDPLLKDFRQIFNLDGVSIDTSTQHLKLFYVNLEQTTSSSGFDSNSGRVVRGSGYQAGSRSSRSGTAPVLNEVSAAANARRAIVRLGDVTTSTFGKVNTNTQNYGLGSSTATLLQSSNRPSGSPTTP
jgi:hypothetical protein